MVVTLAKPEMLNASSIAGQTSTPASAVSAPTMQSRLSTLQQTYHELNHPHAQEVDVLVQLRSNLAQLEDLHGRLRYMMGELSYLLKRD